MDFRDERVVLFPVVEGEGFVVMVVLPRALLVLLDLLVVGTVVEKVGGRVCVVIEDIGHLMYRGQFKGSD